MNLTAIKTDRKKILQDIHRLRRMIEPNMRSAASALGQQLSERVMQMFQQLNIPAQDSLKELDLLKTQLMLLNRHLELLPRMEPHISLQEKVRMCREIEALSKRIQHARSV
jgi:hypothetical protein